MTADVLILGQGLAGTLLGWELERASVPFTITDSDQAPAATAAAAGIINPITGRRLVQSWRIDALRPLARETYRAIEAAWGVRVWHEMKLRRLFADERERVVLAAKRATGELAGWAGEGDDSGFWIRDAARVDLGVLLAAARARWRAGGQWRAAGDKAPLPATVIACTGLAMTATPEFGFVPWEVVKGEIIELAVDGLAPDVILNRRHWLVPMGEGAAWVGATQEPGVRDPQPSAAARATLEAAARDLLGGRAFRVTGQRAGVRVHLPDKRPVAGWHPVRSGLGVLGGLGAKGALWAPWLARQWADHLTRGGAVFDPETDVGRFAG